ncbi:MAG: hypothetical protein QE570_14270 [Verrucomicrobiota bacterium]|nr:hypothetical protein [Verrucomicrobiota bacterium]
MNLGSLQHLVCSVRTLAEDCQVIVLGSASLLASFPELGDGSEPLTATYDADLCPQPFDETTALMIHESLGESGAFHLRHGYHVDVLRDTIFETLPQGWRERLVPVPGCDGAAALEPHDLAATKLLVGRAKDIALVRHLASSGRVSRQLVEQRLDSIPKAERLIITSGQALQQAFDSAQ